MKNPSSIYRAKKRVAAPLMIFLGAVLLLVNVLLVQQNKKLRVLARKPDRALEIKPGTAVPPLEGLDSNGNRHRINDRQDSRKTVLLVLSPRCHACEENMPNLEAIIDGLDRQSFQIAAVSLQPDDFNKYSSRRRINQIPILTRIDPKYRVAYNLALTPQIILIDAGGKVEKVWTGLLQEEAKREVELALDVRLP
jgi:peroxiredoxin